MRDWQTVVVARLVVASAAAAICLAGGPMGAAAGGMAPAVDSYSAFDSEFDSTVDQGPTPCHLPGAPAPCYEPLQIRTAYDVQALLDNGVTGAGRTIVIVDAFQDPTLAADVAKFDHLEGLADPIMAPPIAPDGLTAFDGSKLQVGWAKEIAVDVEWAHVIAPGATIQLVLAKSETEVNLLSAVRYAVDNNLGDVISQSFGEAEACAPAGFLDSQHAVFEQAVAKGMTIIAASGDQGSAQPSCDGSHLIAGVSTPASDPLVTAVGGTRLIADPVTGAYGSEVGWGDRFGASGGGFSEVYRRPGYQAPFQKNNRARGVPDVAWSADAFGTVPAIALGHGGFIFGTSAPTAEWAGVAALADQAAGHRLGALNTSIYHAAKGHAAIGALHDVTSGSSSFAGFSGFSAGDDWDPVTGVGTPDVAVLVAWLAQA